MTTIWTPHSDKQDRAIFSAHPITLLATGIQYGKTEVGAVRTKIKMHTYTEPDDAFLVLAPTYKIMQQSSLPAFLRLMDGYGQYHKAAAVFEMYNGGICYMRTGTDPDSIVGIRNVRHIWGDEAGLFSLYFWENILARAAFRNAQIDLTTSPYSLNWIYKDLIRGVRDGTRDDVLYIAARSNENPFFPQDVYEQRQRTMDARRFRMVFGGAFERMEGLVYDCFDEQENMCDWPEYNPEAIYYAGIDWGYTQEFAMTIRAFYPDGSEYQVGEIKKARLGLTELIDLAKQKKQIFGIKHFYAGPDQPGYIEEFNRAGLPTSPANNDVKKGIALHYEALKERKLKIVRNTSPHTLDELDMYHYPDPKDLKPDQDEKEQNPVKQNDHVMDASRYLTIMTRHVGKMRAPHKPGEGNKDLPSHYARAQQLTKKRANGRSEKWS